MFRTLCAFYTSIFIKGRVFNNTPQNPASRYSSFGIIVVFFYFYTDGLTTLLDFLQHKSLHLCHVMRRHWAIPMYNTFSKAIVQNPITNTNAFNVINVYVIKVSSYKRWSGSSIFNTKPHNNVNNNCKLANICSQSSVGSLYGVFWVKNKI